MALIDVEFLGTVSLAFTDNEGLAVVAGGGVDGPGSRSSLLHMSGMQHLEVQLAMTCP